MLSRQPHIRCLPYFILDEPEPAGRCIGYLGDAPISEYVTDYFGRSYVYVGMAPRTWAGDLDIEALANDEFVLPPSLLYRRCKIASARTPGLIARARRALHDRALGPR